MLFPPTSVTPETVTAFPPTRTSSSSTVVSSTRLSPALIKVPFSPSPTSIFWISSSFGSPVTTSSPVLVELRMLLAPGPIYVPLLLLPTGISCSSSPAFVVLQTPLLPAMIVVPDTVYTVSSLITVVVFRTPLSPAEIQVTLAVPLFTVISCWSSPVVVLAVVLQTPLAPTLIELPLTGSVYISSSPAFAVSRYLLVPGPTHVGRLATSSPERVESMYPSS